MGWPTAYKMCVVAIQEIVGQFVRNGESRSWVEADRGIELRVVDEKELVSMVVVLQLPVESVAEVVTRDSKQRVFCSCNAKRVNRGEFISESLMELEADAFAAGLLMPTRLMHHHVNREPLSPEFLSGIAEQFETSLTSTAVRAVQCSHFPCAVCFIRGGKVVWREQSESVVEAKLYPKAGLHSATTVAAFREFQQGRLVSSTSEANATEWFDSYRNHDVVVTEHYIPVGVLDTLVTLLTFDEEDLFPETDSE